MKTVKKATIAVVVISSVLGAGIAGFILGASIWANKPRGVRIPLDEEKASRPNNRIMKNGPLGYCENTVSEGAFLFVFVRRSSGRYECILSAITHLTGP